MFNLYWDGVTYELPVTDEEWNWFILGKGSEVIEYLLDEIDYPADRVLERWILISRFNDWIMLNLERFELAECFDSINMRCYAIDMRYHVYNDPDQDTSRNDHILWQRCQEILSTK